MPLLLRQDLGQQGLLAGGVVGNEARDDALQLGAQRRRLGGRGALSL
jgi:hypothetical protein